MELPNYCFISVCTVSAQDLQGACQIAFVTGPGLKGTLYKLSTLLTRDLKDVKEALIFFRQLDAVSFCLKSLLTISFAHSLDEDETHTRSIVLVGV